MEHPIHTQKKAMSMLLNKSNGDYASFTVDDFNWDALNQGNVSRNIYTPYNITWSCNREHALLIAL
jgi:hypothetical protein